jgi:uncharacterized protein
MSRSTSLHERAEQLTEKTINFHRAMLSLTEELEAVDWYTQRAEACKDAQLQAVLKHNRDEEIEHASMTLEWIRRNAPKFDESLRLYLFKSGDITTKEEAAKSESEDTEAAIESPRRSRRFTVGEMKGN